MKRQLSTMFILATGLALLLGFAVVAQGAEMKAVDGVSPHIVSTDRMEDSPSYYNTVRLGHTSNITFTPSFTVY